MQRGIDGEIIEPLVVIVMGVSGSGKSTLAALLARKLNCPFFEGDSFHSDAAIARMTAGKPLRDEDRWPFLDRLGGAIDAELGSTGLAVAACSALKHSYRERLRSAIAAPVSLILLDNDRFELARRLNDRVGHYMPASLLESQLATLERPSPRENALILDGRCSPEALAGAAISWLGQSAQPTAPD